MTKRDHFFSVWAWGTGLVCPVCAAGIQRDRENLRCGEGHVLSVNRKGYLNVLSRPVRGAYDTGLFTARGLVLDSGLYQPVLQCIQQSLPSGSIRLTDCGCGEGWWLQKVLEIRPDAVGIGMDLSAQAIALATAREAQALWLVADLRNIPLADHSQDVVMNILTPASYREFNRILKPDGCLIKVYPGGQYLREIREKRGMTLYEDGDVEAYLRMHCRDMHTTRVSYKQALSPELAKAMVRMTPLNQDMTEDMREQLEEDAPQTVTIDLYVSVCYL